MKRMLSLVLAILLLFSMALAEETAAAPSETETAGTASTETENYMIPRQFMSMFDASLEIYAGQYMDSEEAERLVKDYSLTKYDFSGSRMYYGSEDWRIEAGFEFENEEAVSPDSPSVSWYLFISDAAEEAAWYLAMYTLNNMIIYTHQDYADEILYYFRTVTPGDVLELPDGYALVTYRTENDDGIMFELYPSSGDSSAAGSQSE